MTIWEAITKRSLDEVDAADPLYRPTNFWQPGLHQLLSDMDELGLERFKSWPSAAYWFYPTYASNVRPETAAAALERAVEVQPEVPQPWLRDALSGGSEARRDLEVARILWDQARWPFKVMARGEALIGEPPQHFRLAGDKRGWTKPYLNYLLCMAALSRHVDRPPRSVLEIGGGFGMLGEILMRRSGHPLHRPGHPAVAAVASYYLRSCSASASPCTTTASAGPGWTTGSVGGAAARGRSTTSSGRSTCSSTASRSRRWSRRRRQLRAQGRREGCLVRRLAQLPQRKARPATPGSACGSR